MAIVIENESRCSICNEILNKTKEYIMTPPLISNGLDELFIVSDEGVHLECLNKSDFKSKLLKYLKLNKQYLSKMRALMLENYPKDVIGFNLLSSDDNEAISKYNYFIIIAKGSCKLE